MGVIAAQNRVKPQDLVLMQQVCETCEDIPAFKFTVVVNLCSPGYMANTAAQEDFKKGIWELLGKNRASCAGFIFLPLTADMDSQENRVWQIPGEKRRQLDSAANAIIDPSKLKYVKVENYERKINEYKTKINRLE